MANYFVINSKFQPYSFDELMKPYQMYAEEYDKQTALLDAAREKEFSPDGLDKDADAVAYDMYNNAAAGLKAASDELATRGLSSKLRAQIRNTARDYKRTMDSLNQAQERLFAEQDRRAKLGPDYVYQQNNLRIGDFLNGATPNQRGESLTTIANDIAKEFSARAKGITDDTWSKVLDKNGKVVGGYYDVTTRSGLTAAQLDTILSDDGTWNSIMQDESINAGEKRNLQRFREAIQNKKDAVGFNDFNTLDQNKIQNAINLGATAGLETTSHEYKKDEGYDPLGWSRLAFEKEKYGASQAASNIALQVKYPQYQFDDKGNLVKDENGAIKINPGWAERNGKWYGPNGQVVDDEDAGKQPLVKPQMWRQNGEYHKFENEKDFNAKGWHGTGVTNASELSSKNIQRLAIALGVTTPMSREEVFNLAVRRGVSVSVINHGFNKNADGDKTPKDDQELIISGSKPIDQMGGNTPATDGGVAYDEDAS